MDISDISFITILFYVQLIICLAIAFAGSDTERGVSDKLREWAWIWLWIILPIQLFIWFLFFYAS